MVAIRKRQWVSPKGKRQTRWLVDFRDGLGRRKAKQFATKEQAREWVDKTNFKEFNGNTPVTIAEVARGWVKKRETEGLERTTINYYRHVAENYIIPAFGHLRADQLTQAQIVDHWNHLNATKSAHTGRSFVRHIKMMLNYGVRADLIVKNVAADLRTSLRSRTRRRNRPKIPTLQEAQALLRVIDSKPEPAENEGARARWLAKLRVRPLFRTIYETACRPSEVRGLPWKRVHLDAGYIEITQRADRFCKIGDCKSDAAYRKLPISPELSQALAEWKDVCPSSTKNLVFPTASGRPVGARWIAKAFKRIQIHAGVVKPLLDEDGRPMLTARGKPRVDGKYTLYGMRHLRASLWIDERLNLKRLQTRMGHSSIQMTFDVYGHLLAEDENDSRL